MRTIVVLVFALVSPAVMFGAETEQPPTDPPGSTPQELIDLMAAVIADSERLNRFSKVTETWECFDQFDAEFGAPLVTLNRWDGAGKVTVAQTDHPAFFEVEGLNRRWNFGRDLKFSFLIKPNGIGLYLDFFGVEEGGTTNPSQYYMCRQL